MSTWRGRLGGRGMIKSLREAYYFEERGRYQRVVGEVGWEGGGGREMIKSLREAYYSEERGRYQREVG